MEHSFILNLYEQMKKNPNLAGSYKLENGTCIEWKLFDSLTIHIAQEYICIDGLLFNKIPKQVTHWHPDDDEIYEHICAMGTKGNVTVIRKSLLGESVIYMGPASECPHTRKRCLGKYYYLYAE